MDKNFYVVKVPAINGLGKTDGCEQSGNAILNSIKEIYSNEQGKAINTNLLDLEEIHLDNSNLKFTNELIYKNSFKIFEIKPKTIFLGGDHSISYPITRAFLNHCQNSDCMEPIDKKFPTHEEWLRGLINDGFPAENILLVGVRNSDIKEIKFLREKNIKIISMNQLLEDLQEMCDVIMEFSNNKELYISIDIDVIDPAFAPSTGYQEPGGLTSRQFLYLIQRMNKIKTLRAVDIVEINENKDRKNNGLTVKLGAKILAELI